MNKSSVKGSFRIDRTPPTVRVYTTKPKHIKYDPFKLNVRLVSNEQLKSKTLKLRYEQYGGGSNIPLNTNDNQIWFGDETFDPRNDKIKFSIQCEDLAGNRQHKILTGEYTNIEESRGITFGAYVPLKKMSALKTYQELNRVFHILSDLL